MRPYLTVDEKQVRKLQRDLREVPNVLDKEVPEALNKTIEKTENDIVDRMAAANPGIKKQYIRRASRTTKASPSNWSAEVGLSGPGVPVADLDVRLGRKTEVTEIASKKQSLWLYYNVFKPKYGATAIFSTAYRIARKVHQNITYRVSGQTRSLAGTGAFPIDMRFGRTGIFKRRKGFGGIREKLREMRGPSLFEMLDENTAMLKGITDDNVKGFERELEKLNRRHSMFIPRQSMTEVTEVSG